MNPPRTDSHSVSCRTHPAERSAGTCRSCLHEYCDHCLVYSYGRAKPPHCMSCALEAAGVRCTDAQAPRSCSDN